MKRTPKVIVKKAADGSFWVSCIAANGKVVYTAHGYNTRRNAWRSIWALYAILTEGIAENR